MNPISNDPIPVLMGAFFLLFGLSMPTRSQNPEFRDLEADYERHAQRAVAKDAFPVFNNPTLTRAAGARNRMKPNEWVIGVEFNGDARAYPIEVMGVHELGNDTVGGRPIAVCW